MGHTALPWTLDGFRGTPSRQGRSIETGAGAKERKATASEKKNEKSADISNTRCFAVMPGGNTGAVVMNFVCAAVLHRHPSCVL